MMDERRSEPRRRILKTAKILINDDRSGFDCVVQDISPSGAKVSLGLFQPLPKRFKLVVNGLGTHFCEWVRTTGTEFGVRFIAPDSVAA